MNIEHVTFLLFVLLNLVKTQKKQNRSRRQFVSTRNKQNQIQMKTLRTIKFFSLLTLTSLALTSCSNDDDANDNTGQTTTSTKLYTSNNANGNITYYDVTDMANVSTTTFITGSVAADGIFFDSQNDVLVQASRSGLALEGFTSIATQNSGDVLSAGITGTADMTSPREVAVSNNFYVVADNADADGDSTTPDGKLYIYQKSGTSFSLRNTITTDFKVWGITFIGGDLYAIVDTTNELAVFTSFLSNTTDATVSASKTIKVEGIVRTHGITYDGSSNTAVLTDIGDAASGTDGGFHIIGGFTSKFSTTPNGGTLALSDQTRVSGSSTLLGNPVDVAYDGSTETVFIAEAKNGKILAFNSIGSGGNLMPAMSYDLTSASAVYLSKS